MNKSYKLGVITLCIFLIGGTLAFMERSSPQKPQGFDLFGACEDETFLTLQNPEKNPKVKGFVRDCGATTDFVTNIVIEEESVSDPVLVLKGYRAQQCDVVWEQSDILRINCSVPESSIITTKSTYKNIRVLFKNTPPVKNPTIIPFWEVYSYPGFQIKFPEKPYITPGNSGPQTKSVTYRAGQEDGTQYFITTTDLSPRKNEAHVYLDMNFLKTVAETTRLNILGNEGQLEGVTDTSNLTGYISMDFFVNIPDGPRTYMARNIVSKNIVYEMRVVYTNRSSENARYREFFDSFKIK